MQDDHLRGQAISSPAAVEGNVFVGGGFSSSVFYCLSAETGARKWDAQLSDNGPSAPSYYQGTVLFTTESCIAGGKLFVATRGGQLLRVDPQGGRITGRVALGAPAASQPVIEGGRIFVGTRNGELVCVRTSDPKLTGWNQWGGNADRSNIDDADPEMKTMPRADRRRMSPGLQSLDSRNRPERSSAAPFVSLN